MRVKRLEAKRTMLSNELSKLGAGPGKQGHLSLQGIPQVVVLALLHNLRGGTNQMSSKEKTANCKKVSDIAGYTSWGIPLSATQPPKGKVDRNRRCHRKPRGWSFSVMCRH